MGGKAAARWPQGADDVVNAVGGASDLLDAVFAAIEVEVEMIVTTLTRAGLVNRLRLAGGVPRRVLFNFQPGRVWRPTWGTLQSAFGPHTRARAASCQPAMPGGVPGIGDAAPLAALRARHDPG